MAPPRHQVPADKSARGSHAASGSNATHGTEAATRTRLTEAARETKAKAPAGKTRAGRTSAAKKAIAKRPEEPSAAAATSPVADQNAPVPAKLKQKLVRDSFTMPKPDFALIEMLKGRMVAYKRPTRKSELLRAGLHALMALPDVRLEAALDELAPLKAGRPRKTS